jgi:CheY-like chemotaxis protein
MKDILWMHMLTLIRLCQNSGLTTMILALLDYLMPHLNGLELYRRIREIDSRMRGLILTATHEQLTADEDNPQRGKNLRVIRKSISNEELLRNVNSILN